MTSDVSHAIFIVNIKIDNKLIMKRQATISELLDKKVCVFANDLHIFNWTAKRQLSATS